MYKIDTFLQQFNVERTSPLFQTILKNNKFIKYHIQKHYTSLPKYLQDIPHMIVLYLISLSFICLMIDQLN